MSGQNRKGNRFSRHCARHPIELELTGREQWKGLVGHYRPRPTKSYVGRRVRQETTAETGATTRITCQPKSVVDAQLEQACSIAVGYRV